jgi:hypothetical protein
MGITKLDHNLPSVGPVGPNHSLHQTLPLRGIAGEFES